MRRGGISRLTVTGSTAEALPFAAGAFDAVTALEVVGHQADPLPMARKAVAIARRCVIVSVPSQPDDNPEHVHLFSRRSLDALREDLGVDPASAQGPVIAAAREQARQALRAGALLVWNGTNLGRARRAALIDLLADYRAKARIVCLEASPAEIERRNRARERAVPARALARMLAHWEPPDLTECHDLDIVLG